MSDKTKEQRKRLNTLVLMEGRSGFRQLDSILLFRNGRLTHRIDVSKYDEAVLNLLGGSAGEHSLELYSSTTGTKMPARSGHGVSEFLYSAAFAIFAGIGALVTISAVADAFT